MRDQPALPACATLAHVSRRDFDPLDYRDPAPFAPLIRAMGPINRHLVLPRLLRLRALDFPRADLERLRAAVNPATAAFLGPNHPEFMTDWMLDKEVSRRVSPLMAHWASYEIVNQTPLAQRFWLANNLIANAPGGGGREYSIRWALAGHGVLLHPEGTATWQADRVGALVPGIVDMAWDTCRRAAESGGARPVFIVPLVWKLHFERDVSAPLAAEMAHLERALALPRGDGLGLEQRFAALMLHVLRARRAEFLGADAAAREPEITARTFFAAQAALAKRLLHDLEARYGRADGDLRRRAFALRRAIREGAASDPTRATLSEAERLRHFDPAIYDRPMLAQEHIAETLKHTRLALVRGGVREALHGLVPVAVAPRIAHIRVPEPLDVSATFARGGDEAQAKAALLDVLHARLQGGVDALIAECAPLVDRFRRPNPFWSGGAAS